MKFCETENNILLNLSDTPCSSVEEDVLNVNERIVNKIHSLVIKRAISPLTLAIVGEWGIGKSSVINLLKKKLQSDKYAIIISFEPLLEGKMELSNILELFYLQLHEKIDDNKAKEIIKTSLKSLALLTRFKLSAGVSIPSNMGIDAKLNIEKDFSKDIDDIINLWSKQKLKLFSEQAERLNNCLREKKLELYVIIDELDRLTSEQIINFLLFMRTIELFNNLTCIVGFDYAQVLRKLMSEKYLGSDDYISAKSYIDKFFQYAFLINHNESRKIELAQKLMRKIDKKNENNVLYDFINPHDYEDYSQVRNIINYLSTPRLIKKWIISISANYSLIQYSPKKLSFLKFLATITVDPIVFENYAKYLQGSDSATRENMGRDDDNKGKKISLGVLAKLKPNKNDDTFPPLHEEWRKVQFEKFINAFSSDTPAYLQSLFIEGYSDNNTVSAYYNFINNDASSTMKVLMEDGSMSDILAGDLAKDIGKTILEIQKPPTIDLLNALWRKKCGESLFNPYYHIVSFCLKQFTSFEEVIKGVDLSLSEQLLLSCLSAFGVKNENGKYDIEQFVIQAKNNLSGNIIFKTINSKNDALNILEKWLAKVEFEFKDNKSNLFKQHGLISVFYRFIQFGNILQQDKRQELASMLNGLVLDRKISINDKCIMVELITTECKKYESNLLGEQKSPPPLEILFYNDTDLIKNIQKFLKENGNVKYIDSFNKLIGAENITT